MTNQPEKLRPANRDDLLASIEFGMKFNRGKASNAAREVAASALARMVLEHLESSGYVVMKSPSAPPHFIGLGNPHLTD